MTPSPAPQHGTDAAAFAGSVPAMYDELLVPMIFEPYALDLAERVAALAPRRVLEVAAGTGAVTRALARALDPAVEIVATDLNAPMLERAMTVGTARAVRWQTADAMALPFDDAQFDVVVCQFGAMFFPDKAHAYAQARRVLRPGGVLLFSVWDRIDTNDFADVVTCTLAARLPADPPMFLARTPHGYHDRGVIEGHLRDGGFGMPRRFDTLAMPSPAASAHDVATAYCHGTPLRNEIEQRLPGRLAEATGWCTAALAGRFGPGAVEGRIQAHVVEAAR